MPLEGLGRGAETPVCGDTTFLFQAEIVKRLSAICTQMMPFLTQEVGGGRRCALGCAGRGEHESSLTSGRLGGKPLSLGSAGVAPARGAV